jgi:hypothetical protein
MWSSQLDTRLQTAHVNTVNLTLVVYHHCQPGKYHVALLRQIPLQRGRQREPPQTGSQPKVGQSGHQTCIEH